MVMGSAIVESPASWCSRKRTTGIGTGSLTRHNDPPMRALAAHLPHLSRRLTTASLAQGPRWFWACAQSPACKSFFGWADGGPNLSYRDPPNAGEVNGAAAPAPAGPSHHRQVASPARASAGQQFHTTASGGAAARHMPASMGCNHWNASTPGLSSPAGGRGGMQQSGSPQTPNAARGSQTTARTPQGAGLRFQQIDSQKFAVSFPYDKEVIDSLKETIWARDREWHPETKTWRFHLDKYQDLQNWALEHFPANGITLLEQNAPEREIPRPHLESESGVEAQIRKFITAETWERLYPFQMEGVRFALRRRGRALIADEMGLGKTVQAICVAACYFPNWPLLVVCPSSMMLTWLDLLRNWLPRDLLSDEANMVLITSSKDVDKKLDVVNGPLTPRHIVIASYECAQKLRGYERRFGMLICDESHALKSPATKRTQFFADLTAPGGNVRRLIFLTGTPLLSRPIEAYPQIDMLSPGLMGTYDQFGERYCGAKVQVAPGKMDWRGAQNLEVLNGILREHLLIRRLKKDVLHELPSMQRHRRTVLPDPDLLPVIEEVKREMAQLDSMADRMTEEAYESAKQVLLMKLYRATGPAKVKAACEQIETVLTQPGCKVLVFAHHKAVLDALETAVKKLRVGEDGRLQQVGHMRIDGRSSAQARGDAVSAFQTDPNCRVALLSIRAAGTGITLTAASTVLFVELAWTPTELTQAEARAHRMGQEKEVEMLYLLAPGTVDDIIWSMVKSKLRVVGNALDGHLAGTATGLQITDARPFIPWAAGGPVGVPPSDDEEDAKTGASPADGMSSQPLLTTPESLRDMRAEPSGSGTRRRRSTSPDKGGRSGATRRRLDFPNAGTSLQAEEPEVVLSQASNCIDGSAAVGNTLATQQTSRDPFFSDSDDVWNTSARVSTLDGAVPAAATQRMPSQPSQPGVGPSSRRGNGGGRGLGVFANNNDDDLDAALASPEMDALLSQRSSQRQPSQPARPSQDAAAPAGRACGGGSSRRAAAEQPTQPYPPVQPQYSPYGRPPQGNAPPSGAAAGGTAGHRGVASAWDYPTQPAAEIVDLSAEECIELE